jgi:catechol 2,3-dioxygenase-like lactoylglutathione lyase family enzyme
MHITNVVPQLRTTDLAASIRFYTALPGFEVAFRFEDFYAGVRAGAHVFHLKLVDEKDPSIEIAARDEHFHLYFQTSDIDAAAADVRRAGVPIVRDVHETEWGTREFVIHDDQGHILYFGQPHAAPNAD